MRKKPTLTIGIPAYNEAETIGSLLHHVRRQVISTACIKEVIIYSDGSTDETDTIVLRQNMSNLTHITSKERHGKSHAMNQIFKQAKTDILVIIDADIHIPDERMIEKLVDPVIKNGADLTSARVKEFWTKSKFEEILKISMRLKKDIFESYKKGNNIYTCHGRARAFSKPLYQKIKFNKDIIAEDAYSYLFTVFHGFTYLFAKEANVYYRLPGTVRDHQKQSVRFIQSYQQLAQEFGKELIARETYLPKKIVLLFILSYMCKYPLTLMMYIGIFVYMHVRSLLVNEKYVTWAISPSTKLGFTK